MEEALDYYVTLQQELDIEKPADDDVQSPHQQQQQLPTGSIPGRSYVADKTSSVDALGFGFADHKFRVQKIVARPAVK